MELKIKINMFKLRVLYSILILGQGMQDSLHLYTLWGGEHLFSFIDL